MEELKKWSTAGLARVWLGNIQVLIGILITLFTLFAMYRLMESVNRLRAVVFM